MMKRAVVLEIKERTCTVLTADGQFREIKKKANYRPGQEITMPGEVYRGKYYLVAACLLFFLAAATLWGGWMMTPAVAAYVSLDINPSVEMALDKENMVIAIDSLNDDGKYLIEGLTLKGLSLEVAIENIVRSAVNKEYIISGEDNVVVAAVTPLETDASRVEMLVTESIRLSMDKNSVKAQIVVGEVISVNRDKAVKKGISAGRYMIFLDASKEGGDVKPEDFKDKGRFKSEIINKVKAEKRSGEPGGAGKKHRGGNIRDNDGKYSESDSKKQGKESDPGDGKGPEGDRSQGRSGANLPGIDKELDKNREKAAEKDKSKGSDTEESQDREGKKGKAGNHGGDSPRPKDTP